MTSYLNTKTKYRDKAYLESGANKKNFNNPKMKFMQRPHQMNKKMIGG